MSVVTPLQLRAIGKRFGRLAVLRDVNLTVGDGEIVGLIGANGSGKTTLLSIAMGLLPMSDGERRLGGERVDDISLQQRAAMAFVTHTTQLYPGLTARENMQLWRSLRQAVDAPFGDIEPVLERLGLSHAIDRTVGTFSRGMMQRLCLARALAGRPQLLLLDEPFTSLDPPGRGRLAQVLREEADRGLAVLLSSHDYDAIIDVTDRVVLLSGGRIVGEAVRTDADRGDGYRDAVLALGRGSTREAARA